jgi:uncharacterized membrane protein SpoIIM required for sporulation
VDLESINVKFYFTSFICWGGGGVFFVVVISLLLVVGAMVGVAFLLCWSVVKYSRIMSEI